MTSEETPPDAGNNRTKKILKRSTLVAVLISISMATVYFMNGHHVAYHGNFADKKAFRKQFVTPLRNDLQKQEFRDGELSNKDNPAPRGYNAPAGRADNAPYGRPGGVPDKAQNQRSYNGPAPKVGYQPDRTSYDGPDQRSYRAPNQRYRDMQYTGNAVGIQGRQRQRPFLARPNVKNQPLRAQQAAPYAPYRNFNRPMNRNMYDYQYQRGRGNLDYYYYNNKPVQRPVLDYQYYNYEGPNGRPDMSNQGYEKANLQNVQHPVVGKPVPQTQQVKSRGENENKQLVNQDTIVDNHDPREEDINKDYSQFDTTDRTNIHRTDGPGVQKTSGENENPVVNQDTGGDSHDPREEDINKDYSLSTTFDTTDSTNALRMGGPGVQKTRGETGKSSVNQDTGGDNYGSQKDNSLFGTTDSTSTQRIDGRVVQKQGPVPVLSENSLTTDTEKINKPISSVKENVNNEEKNDSNGEMKQQEDGMNKDHLIEKVEAFVNDHESKTKHESAMQHAAPGNTSGNISGDKISTDDQRKSSVDERNENTLTSVMEKSENKSNILNKFIQNVSKMPVSDLKDATESENKNIDSTPTPDVASEPIANDAKENRHEMDLKHLTDKSKASDYEKSQSDVIKHPQAENSNENIIDKNTEKEPETYNVPKPFGLVSMFNWNTPNPDPSEDNAVNCINMRTVFSSADICIHDVKRDPEASTSLQNQGSWQTRMVQDVQLAVLSGKEIGLIDIGTGIGVFALEVASLNRKVIAVEPCLHNIWKMKKSVEMNKLSAHIVLLRNVISNHARRFILKHNDGNVNNVDMHPMDRWGSGNGEVVNAITLNDIAYAITLKEAVLRIDIPGFEASVLQESEALFEHVDIVCAFIPWDINDPKLCKFIIDFFVKKGYKPYNRYVSMPLDMKYSSEWSYKYILWRKPRKMKRW